MERQGRTTSAIANRGIGTSFFWLLIYRNIRGIDNDRGSVVMTDGSPRLCYRTNEIPPDQSARDLRVHSQLVFLKQEREKDSRPRPNERTKPR